MAATSAPPELLMMTKGKEERAEQTELRAPKVADTLRGIQLTTYSQRQSLDKEGEPQVDVAYGLFFVSAYSLMKANQ